MRFAYMTRYVMFAAEFLLPIYLGATKSQFPLMAAGYIHLMIVVTFSGTQQAVSRSVYLTVRDFFFKKNPALVFQTG